jgi:hypothetical protein
VRRVVVMGVVIFACLLACLFCFVLFVCLGLGVGGCC